MRKILCLVLSAVLLGTVATSAVQAEMKPVATVSFAGIHRLLANLDMLAQLGALKNFNKERATANGFDGMDPARSWTFVLLANGSRSARCVYLPIANFEKFFEVIQRQQPQLSVRFKRKLTGDIYEFETSSQTVYLQRKGDWAVVTDSKDNLATAPADPLKLGGDMPKDYDLAARVSVQNIPAEYREQAIAAVRTAIESGAARMPSVTDADQAVRTEAVDQSVRKINQLFDDLDNVVLGWHIDPGKNTMRLDLDMTAKPGTKLAKQFAVMKPGKTDFAGFLVPEAVLNINWSHAFSDADVAEGRRKLAATHKATLAHLTDEGLSDDETKLASRLIGDIFDVFEKTLDSKKNDGGLAVLLDHGSSAGIAGITISDSAKLEKVLRQIVDELKTSEPDVAKLVKLDAETYQGVRFHTMTLPTPHEELKPWVGDTLEVAVGITDGKLMLAAGTDAVGRLKTAIDQSAVEPGKDVPALQITTCVSTILKLALANTKDRMVKTPIEASFAMLEQAAGQDHVQLTANGTPNGICIRMEFEEGLLKTLCGMSTSVTSMMPPGGMPENSDN